MRQPWKSPCRARWHRINHNRVTLANVSPVTSDGERPAAKTGYKLNAGAHHLCWMPCFVSKFLFGHLCASICRPFIISFLMKKGEVPSFMRKDIIKKYFFFVSENDALSINNKQRWPMHLCPSVVYYEDIKGEQNTIIRHDIVVTCFWLWS
jgi:hypothetical protein